MSVERIGIAGLALAIAAGLWWIRGEVAGVHEAVNGVRDDFTAAETESMDAPTRRELAQRLTRLSTRVGSLERQMSLAMTFIQARGGDTEGIEAKARDLGDRIAALREDMDLLLGLEWERFEDIELPPQIADAEPPVVAPEPTPDDGEEELELASEPPRDEHREEERAGQRSEEASVVASLFEESEVSWRRDFAEMAGLKAEQREALDRVLDTLYEQRSDVVDRALQGEMRGSKAHDSLRRAHLSAYRELQGLLDSRQRETLRRELQRRNNLYWSIWLSSR